MLTVTGLTKRFGGFTALNAVSFEVKTGEILASSPHDHDAFDLPIMIAGGNGVLKRNTHIAYDSVGNDRQLRDMWFTIMRHVFGMPVTSFGEDARGVANAELTEILA